jgi:hypothetical protein
VQLYNFFNLGTRWSGWSTPSPGRFIPEKETRYPVQEVGWAPGPVWTGAEDLAPPGFDPRTVQPVASRYTDYTFFFILLFKGPKKFIAFMYNYVRNVR